MESCALIEKNAQKCQIVTKLFKGEMMKNTVSGCSIEDAMRLLGGRWRTLLIYYLADGPKRFSDLRRDNPTISHRMLALDLRELETRRRPAPALKDLTSDAAVQRVRA